MNATALDAFLARKVEIDAALKRLRALSADHFNVGPDDVHWGHVGTLDHYLTVLRDLCDSADGAGEYAVKGSV
jgi:hypothetical protein